MALSKILKMRGFVFLNPEKYTEEQVKEKFGEKNYEMFSQFCLGGSAEMQLAGLSGNKLQLTILSSSLSNIPMTGL